MGPSTVSRWPDELAGFNDAFAVLPTCRTPGPLPHPLGYV